MLNLKNFPKAWNILLGSMKGFLGLASSHSNENSTMLIYQHTPKTGGSSLKLAIESQYDKSELLYIYDLENRVSKKDITWYQNYYHNISKRKKRRMKCILGHSAGGFVGVINKPLKAFSILRNPVDRALSLYYYGLSLPEDTRYKFARIIKDNNLKIEQIFGEDLKKYVDINDPYSPFNEFFNGQIRSILRPKRHELKWFLCGPKEKDDSLEKEALEAAIKILDDYYTVGFQEHFEESMDLFSHEFGWKGNLYHRVNVTPKRLSVNEIPKDLRDVIADHNRLDFVLYETMYEKFKKKSNFYQLAIEHESTSFLPSQLYKSSHFNIKTT